VWFDQATKERQRIEEVIDSANNDTKDIQNTGRTRNDTDRKEMPDSDNQGTDGLRYVRWSVEQAEHTDPDSKDPFLQLLEQLAENEVSRGGPSELDFFLGGQSGRIAQQGAAKPFPLTDRDGSTTPSEDDNPWLQRRHISDSAPPNKKRRYIPGGLGGVGRYVDEEGQETPAGSTGPGGYAAIRARRISVGPIH
jgi:hypothetical protein